MEKLLGILAVLQSPQAPKGRGVLCKFGVQYNVKEFASNASCITNQIQSSITTASHPESNSQDINRQNFTFCPFPQIPLHRRTSRGIFTHKLITIIGKQCFYPSKRSNKNNQSTTSTKQQQEQKSQCKEYSSHQIREPSTISYVLRLASLLCMNNHQSSHKCLSAFFHNHIIDSKRIRQGYQVLC